VVKWNKGTPEERVIRDSNKYKYLKENDPMDVLELISRRLPTCMISFSLYVPKTVEDSISR